ncbi:ABC transporter ATP-binding protein [uncultured Aliiroseovarius sp.]|uniref:ABC transporter ATP-binding protein n=1 Tax=uncultured Aliiroseovarius sp. TaxID=1658783 RepID=UPI002628E6F9|nr:ABC transporter ATP-binding protein [uncultured Aliiroseovarius sp.]
MVLRFEAVQKSFRDSEGSVPVLRDVSFDLEAGQTLALQGESGSGKSTLLHIAGALEDADAGHVWVSGKDLTTLDDRARAVLRRTDIALVFQQFNLIPSLTVAANIEFQAALSGRVDPVHIDRIVAALGLSDQLKKYPEALSGGQQQRVAIARAIAAKPKLLLADEPTGNLDEATAEDVLTQMLNLVSQTGATLMVVTHSPIIAARMDRQLHLHGGCLT